MVLCKCQPSQITQVTLNILSQLHRFPSVHILALHHNGIGAVTISDSFTNPHPAPIICRQITSKYHYTSIYSVNATFFRVITGLIALSNDCDTYKQAIVMYDEVRGQFGTFFKTLLKIPKHYSKSYIYILKCHSKTCPFTVSFIR